MPIRPPSTPAVRLPSTVALARTSSSNEKTRPRSRSSVCCWKSVIIPAVTMAPGSPTTIISAAAGQVLTHASG